MASALALPGWGTPPARLEPLCRRLRASGVAASTWTYEATGSISHIGAALAEAVAARSSQGPVHLVGHSLGGLASASAVLDHDADVASVTTLNSPWRGTWAAWTADDDEPLGHELRWGSAALARLRDALAAHLEQPAGPRWSVVAASVDLAASPITSLGVPRGPRMEASLVPVTGHSVSLAKERMVEHVTERVVAASTTR